MDLPKQIAKQFRDLYFGENWTDSNLKDNLMDVSWITATKKIHSCNTIAALFYHINYYVDAAIQVLQGGPLDARDKFSFDLPPISSQEQWDAMLENAWKNAETLASLIEQMPERKLWEDFTDKKYGSYYSNLIGTIEHSHYHLGQIVLIKKIIAESNN